MLESRWTFRDEFLTWYTQYSNETTDKDHALICVHWYLWNKDMYGVSKVSQNFVDGILSEEGRKSVSMDMYAHGLTSWDHYNFTLSKVYNQLVFLYSHLKEQGYDKVSLHWVSASSPAVLKLATNYAVEKILLRVPVVNPYEKRQRELWSIKMKKWKQDWEIEVFQDNNWEPVIHSYRFIDDVLEHFSNISYKDVSGKLHIVWWASDTEVPSKELEAFVDRLRDDHWEDKASLILYENQEHVFKSEIKPNIQDFFAEADEFLNTH